MRQIPPATLTTGHWTGKRPRTANRFVYARNSPGAILHRTKGEELRSGRTSVRKTAGRNAFGLRGRCPGMGAYLCCDAGTSGRESKTFLLIDSVLPHSFRTSMGIEALFIM